MKEINDLATKKMIIIGGIIFFFGIIFFYNLIKLGIFNQDSQGTAILNNTVVFEQPKLRVFDETRYINQSPDTIRIHYPYFIVVVPEDTKHITTVYSFTKKQEIASYNDVVLDYYNGSFLYNYHGGHTYYKGKNLNVHCNLGFIKSATDILCVTQNSSDPLFNDLISINPQTLTAKTLYSPQNAITAIYYYKNILYVGEYNYAIHQAYITTNGTRAKINTFVSIIYPAKNNLYSGTFKNDNAQLTASYSQLVIRSGQLVPTLLVKGKIVFY